MIVFPAEISPTFLISARVLQQLSHYYNYNYNYLLLAYLAMRWVPQNLYHLVIQCLENDEFEIIWEEGNARGLISCTVSLHSPGVSKEDHKIPLLGEWASRTRFDLEYKTERQPLDFNARLHSFLIKATLEYEINGTNCEVFRCIIVASLRLFISLRLWLSTVTCILVTRQ
jgi:hypothetical protein